jgi:hypothetical protein
MISLATAFVCFIFFVASHVVLFRFRFVKLQAGHIAVLYLFWLIFGIITSVYLNLFSDWGADKTPLFASSIVFYTFIVWFYFAQCTGLQHGSPSLIIFDTIYNHPNRRVSTVELRQLFTNEAMILPRLSELVQQKYVTFDGTYYTLQPIGKGIVRTILAYRQLICRGIGG